MTDKRPSSNQDQDQHQNPKTPDHIDHDWDGIVELDNPPPRWWLNGLYLSGLLVLIYFILFPALPLGLSSSEGILGWTQITKYKQEIAELEQIRAPFEQKVFKMSAEEIMADPDMLNYVMASTKVLYGDNCAACHGLGGKPLYGMTYPVLADDDWLYGGSIEQIMLTIANGRMGYMPAHADKLNEQELDTLVEFVRNGANAETHPKGMALFIEKECISCHGDNAKGDISVGSANLTDSIWRFSGEPEQIRRTILHGVNEEDDPNTREAVMPKWNEKLGLKLEMQQEALIAGERFDILLWQEQLTGEEIERISQNAIKKLAIYVHEMGGGE